MRYLNFNSYDSKKSKKNLNKKKLLIVSMILVILTALLILGAVYISNAQFRGFLDKYVFRKNITTENVPKIEINADNTDHIFAYDKYLCLLTKNKLTTYSSSGKKDFESEVSIGTPIFASNNRFLALAEKDGQKIYLISGANILWQKDIEGQISRITVNKNGYVTVMVSGTSHKTVAIIFNPDGKELFKTFLSSTTAIDADISNDNKYLAIAEIDTSGSALQSNIKIFSVEKAQTDPSNSIEYMYPANSNEIITNITYQDKNKLICLYDDSIHIIQNNQDSKLLDLNEKKDIFADINLKDNVLNVTEKSSGLFADVQFQITNINTKKCNIYTVTGVPKTVEANNNVIAINLGTEVHFIDCNGWLIKKYSSTQEVKDIILGSSIAGIIYKDKIEIINL